MRACSCTCVWSRRCALRHEHTLQHALLYSPLRQPGPFAFEEAEATTEWLTWAPRQAPERMHSSQASERMHSSIIHAHERHMKVMAASCRHTSTGTHRFQVCVQAQLSYKYHHQRLGGHFNERHRRHDWRVFNIGLRKIHLRRCPKSAVST